MFMNASRGCLRIVPYLPRPCSLSLHYARGFRPFNAFVRFGNANTLRQRCAPSDDPSEANQIMWNILIEKERKKTRTDKAPKRITH